MRNSVVLNELIQSVRAVDLVEYEEFFHALQSVRGRLFFYGSGRTGLSARMACMRFMHLGLYSEVHYVGDVSCPAIKKEDGLFSFSKSGRTKSTLFFHSIAVGVGAKTFSLLGTPDTGLAQSSDACLHVESGPSIQFGGSLFESASLVMADALALDLQNELSIAEQSMWRLHTNFE